ncbi:MAG: (2Fe-2S)-binding protein [Rhodobiaceae bacterium]|nr:(2Fe-2S)-binding protein [Rhodobiaceae bacterium]
MTGIRMYACICNALNDEKVDDALSQGATTVSDVFKHHGCSPRCGSCVNHMRAKVRTASQLQAIATPSPDLAIAAD